MKLTKEEQAMLDGEFGAGVQLAMKIQVAIGEAYDAPGAGFIYRREWINLSNT